MPANPNPTVGETPNVSIYEKCREDRIKENLQRMQNLGIMDLSLKLKSEIRPTKRSYTKANSNPDRRSTAALNTPPQLSVSTRRSSRLKDVTPVTYFEGEEKKGKGSKEEILWLGDGERPEIYTDEHEKLLGNTERIWELFVDGYDKDGKRIYDPVRGKTCHQCRQKTLGYRTQCSQCHPSVTGQFCGDCLYMRYGEHVLEALENPDWKCPGCRGICNCSLCRKHKGWLPTGTAYRKVSQLGYKSVAHYLIQTNKQSETSEDDETDDAPSQASAKRSLSFKEAKAEKDDPTDGLGLQENLDSARKTLSFMDNQTSVIGGGDVKPLDVKEMDPATLVIDGGCDVKPLDVKEMEPASLVIDVGGDVKPLDVKEMDPATPVIVDVEAYSGGKRKMSVEPNPNSIGGRLRQRRKSQA